MTYFTRHNPRIKNILHALASLSFVVWLIGFFGYQLGGWFFGFLGFALIVGLLLIRAGRPKPQIQPND